MLRKSGWWSTITKQIETTYNQLMQNVFHIFASSKGITLSFPQVVWQRVTIFRYVREQKKKFPSRR